MATDAGVSLQAAAPEALAPAAMAAQSAAGPVTLIPASSMNLSAQDLEALASGAAQQETVAGQTVLEFANPVHLAQPSTPALAVPGGVPVAAPGADNTALGAAQVLGAPAVAQGAPSVASGAAAAGTFLPEQGLDASAANPAAPAMGAAAGALPSAAGAAVEAAPEVPAAAEGAADSAGALLGQAQTQSQAAGGNADAPAAALADAGANAASGVSAAAQGLPGSVPMVPPTVPAGLAAGVAGNLTAEGHAGLQGLAPSVAGLPGFVPTVPPTVPAGLAAGVAGNLTAEGQAGFQGLATPSAAGVPGLGSLPTAFPPTVPAGFAMSAADNLTAQAGAQSLAEGAGEQLANASGAVEQTLADALALLSNGSFGGLEFLNGSNGSLPPALEGLDVSSLEGFLNGSNGTLPAALEGLNASSLADLLNNSNGTLDARKEVRKVRRYKLSGRITMKFNMTSCSLVHEESMANISMMAIAMACGIPETNFTKFKTSSSCGRRLASAGRRLSTDTETIEYEVALTDNATAGEVRSALKGLSNSSSSSHEIFAAEMEAMSLPVEDVEVGEVETEEELEAEEATEEVISIFWWVLGGFLILALLVGLCLVAFLLCRRGKPKVAPTRQGPDAYLTGKVPFNKEAEMEERYIKHMLEMERVISAWASGSLPNQEAKLQADALVKQIAAIGTLHSSTHVEELLDKHGLTDSRRVVLEDNYRDLQRACGADPEALLNPGKKQSAACPVM